MEDLSVVLRVIDAFDDFESQEPFRFWSAASVFLTAIYNKFPLNADLWSYSKVFEFWRKAR